MPVSPTAALAGVADDLVVVLVLEALEGLHDHDGASTHPVQPAVGAVEPGHWRSPEVIAAIVSERSPCFVHGPAVGAVEADHGGGNVWPQSEVITAIVSEHSPYFVYGPAVGAVEADHGGGNV